MARIPQYTKPFHAATGLPGPPEWAGYWTFISAAIILGFILFTAQKGTLGIWLGFLNLGDIRGLSLGSLAPTVTPVQQVGAPVGTATVTVPLVGQVTIPGLSILAPGASGVLQGPENTEVLNPGQTFNPFSFIPNLFGGSK